MVEWSASVPMNPRGPGSRRASVPVIIAPLGSITVIYAGWSGLHSCGGAVVSGLGKARVDKAMIKL